MKELLCSALVCIALTGYGQSLVPRDTSFTTYGAFVKAKKTQPFIRIAERNPAGIRSALNITYCSYGQRDMKLDVFYPSKRPTRPVPAVLLIHGGGWRSGDRSQHIPMAKMLAANGYVAITVEYRLSGEALYPAAIHDLKGAIRWTKANAKKYGINPSKVAAWGFSAGGQLAALLASTGGTGRLSGPSPCNPGYSDRVAAVIDVDGILAFNHPESGEGDDSKSTSAATLWFGAPKPAALPLYEEASALTYVTKQHPPILILNSSAERMHAGRNDFTHKLDSLGVYWEVHTFNDAPHPFPLFEPWFDGVLRYTIAFLGEVFN